MAEYFGIVATESGITRAMEMVSGRERAAKEIESFLESGHSVRLFKCVEVDFEVDTLTTVYIRCSVPGIETAQDAGRKFRGR